MGFWGQLLLSDSSEMMEELSGSSMHKKVEKEIVFEMKVKVGIFFSLCRSYFLISVNVFRN